jgi:hypothetical protein
MLKYTKRRQKLSKKKNKNKRKNKKTKKNLGKGPGLMSITLPPLQPRSSNGVYTSNPLNSQGRRIILTPLSRTNSDIETIYKSNPILSQIPSQSSLEDLVNESVIESINELPTDNITEEMNEVINILSDNINSERINSSKKSKSKKRVKINSGNNEIKEYVLDSLEKYEKKIPIRRGIRSCKKRPLIFPCRKKLTVFRNSAEYENYENLKETSNSLTNFRTKTDHYRDISRKLSSEGQILKRNK